VIAVDGFAGERLDHCMASGDMPAIRKLRDDGSSVSLVSTVPATTPVAWATVATGAPPSVHGIEGFLLQPPDQALGDRVSGCFAHRCSAEPLWTSAVLEGRRALVVKFPLAYPSPTPTLRIDGASGWGGLKCLHELVSTAVWSRNPVDGELTIYEGPGDSGTGWRGRVELPCLWQDEVVPVAVHLRGNTVTLSTADEPVLATVTAGRWSAPVVLDAPGRRGRARGAFRIKVLDASEIDHRLRIFSTPLHEIRGHSHPEHLWSRLEELVGPIEEQTEPSLFFAGLIDLDTQLELFALHVDWLTRATTAAVEMIDPHLTMVHVHILDWAHHMLQGAVDPDHPDYHADTAPVYDAALRRCYSLVDGLIGKVTAVMGGGASIAILGDHGQDLHHTTVHLNEHFAALGWLHWNIDDSRPDLGRTRVLAMGNYVYINAADGRPQGIVPTADIAALRAAVITEIRGLRDHRNGQAVVASVGPKGDYREFGGDGRGVGDIVFCLRRGYQAANGRGPLFEPTRALKQFTSGHDHFLPTEKALLTRMYVSGSGFRSGRHVTECRPLVDVAPTLAAILNITSPPSCSGQAIDAVLADRERSP